MATCLSALNKSYCNSSQGWLTELLLWNLQRRSHLTSKNTLRNKIKSHPLLEGWHGGESLILNAYWIIQWFFFLGVGRFLERGFLKKKFLHPSMVITRYQLLDGSYFLKLDCLTAYSHSERLLLWESCFASFSYRNWNFFFLNVVWSRCFKFEWMSEDAFEGNDGLLYTLRFWRLIINNSGWTSHTGNKELLHGLVLW